MRKKISNVALPQQTCLRTHYREDRKGDKMPSSWRDSNPRLFVHEAMRWALNRLCPSQSELNVASTYFSGPSFEASGRKSWVSFNKYLPSLVGHMSLKNDTKSNNSDKKPSKFLFFDRNRSFVRLSSDSNFLFSFFSPSFQLDQNWLMRSFRCF